MVSKFCPITISKYPLLRVIYYITDIFETLRTIMSQRIMILDGGMGTQIQARGLTADDYRGKCIYPNTFIIATFLSSNDNIIVVLFWCAENKN